MKKAFENWWRRGATYIPNLPAWQAAAVHRIARRAFMAGVKLGRALEAQGDCRND